MSLNVQWAVEYLLQVSTSPNVQWLELICSHDGEYSNNETPAGLEVIRPPSV